MKKPRHLWVVLVVSFAAAALGCNGGNTQRATSPGTSPATAGCKKKTTTLTDGFGIWNGTAATAQDYPMVGYLEQHNTESEGFCSGSLVCGNVILTAAHCALEGIGAPTTYNFGQQLTAPLPDAIAAESTPVVESVTNPSVQHDAQNKVVQPAHDLAMFRLRDSIATTIYPLAKTPLADGADPGPVKIVGYGLATTSNQTLGAKRVGTMAWIGHNPDEHAWVATIKEATDNQDTCGGDSGSPLLVQGKIYGVLSGGNGADCGVGTQSWWASVPDDLPWITAQMKKWCTGTTALDITGPTAIGGANDPGPSNPSSPSTSPSSTSPSTSPSAATPDC